MQVESSRALSLPVDDRSGLVHMLTTDSGDTEALPAELIRADETLFDSYQKATQNSSFDSAPFMIFQGNGS